MRRPIETTLAMATVATIALLVWAWALEGSSGSPSASDYEQGMRYWREGNTAEALRHLMAATADPELSFYAARQVALMGPYALPLLHRALWDPREVIERQSAVILGWIGQRSSVEPLLRRMKAPDAPLEVEYALRKIGSVSSAQLMSLIDGNDLSNSKLLDHKVASFARLADGLRLAVDPVPLLHLMEAIETVKAAELAGQPFGHLAEARLNLLRFLAGRKVSAAAPHLVGAFHADGPEPNLVVAGALIGLGRAACEPLEAAFKTTRDPGLQALIGVAHYFASGARELSRSGPVSVVLNRAASNAELAARIASYAARFSKAPNALLTWFRYHPDPEVRIALAPELPDEDVRARRNLKAFYLEKTLDEEPAVAAAHIRFVGGYLPDEEVEQRLERILSSRTGLVVVRRAALETAARHGVVRLMKLVLERIGDPLRQRAVELASSRTEPEVVSAVLRLLRETAPSGAKRAAIEVAAMDWRRAEAEAPLLELLRRGDPLWGEAARGLAALRSQAAGKELLRRIEADRGIGRIDGDEAGAIYFALSGTPCRLEGGPPGPYRFEPLELESRPPPQEVLVLLRERSDFRGWVKVEERWRARRLFRLDEARRELILYDRASYDRVAAGAGVVLLEDTIRQSVLTPLELSELREQKVEVVRELPYYPYAGLESDGIRLVHRGRWIRVGFGKDLRDESGRGGWGRSALVVLGTFDRSRIRYEPHVPPAGWLRGESQPVVRGFF